MSVIKVSLWSEAWAVTHNHDERHSEPSDAEVEASHSSSCIEVSQILVGKIVDQERDPLRRLVSESRPQVSSTSIPDIPPEVRVTQMFVQ